jgi:hypothetical protein
MVATLLLSLACLILAIDATLPPMLAKLLLCAVLAAMLAAMLAAIVELLSKPACRLLIPTLPYCCILCW